VQVNGHSPSCREWVSGRPVFIDEQGKTSYSPAYDDPDMIFDRAVNVSDGSMDWTMNGEPLLDGHGQVVKDTGAIW
jgi:hypothetical protein